VLEHWAGLRRSADVIGSAIQISGLTLAQWLSHFQGGGNLHAVGSKWLKNWGVDLRLLPQDRETRNEASYRPSLTKQNPLDVETSAGFICGLWSLCEPSGSSPFENLDRHLLRIAIEEAFRGVTGMSPKADPSGFEARVTNLVGQVVLDSAMHQQWIDFLKRTVDPDDAVIITQATKTASDDTSDQHVQMISRAALLLRVATAASALLLKSSGISAQEVQFWWSAVGEERGFWDPAGPPTDLKDLWADSDAAIQGIQEWIQNTPSTEKTFAKFRQQRPYEISVLGGCERIALWGLNL
jgi:hypothetical protein